MSSITTAVPSGVVQTNWCILPLQNWETWNIPDPTCANSKLGTSDSDFETICCDGDIVNTKVNILRWPLPANTTFLFEDMVCCGVHGPLQGGIGPAINLATACTEGSPTPLASLAATNKDNAALYEATYTSASFGISTTGDFIPTETPSCMWVYTKTGIALSNVTVPAAQITTLPPASTDAFGYPVSAISTSQSYSSYTTSSSASPASASSTSRSAGFHSSMLPSKLLLVPLLVGWLMIRNTS